jgi:hypothetical protein
MCLRAHVRLVAAIWLTCQVAAFAASPFVLCHDHGVMQTADGHECDPVHHHHEQPAAATPSHEHHHHSTAASDQTTDRASLNCRCTISDAALAALILEAGVLPGAFAFSPNVTATRVVIPDYAAPTRSQQIDTPPPRA